MGTCTSSGAACTHHARANTHSRHVTVYPMVWPVRPSAERRVPDAELPTGAPECSAIANGSWPLRSTTPFSALHRSIICTTTFYNVPERARARQKVCEHQSDCSREFRQNLKHGSACVRYRRTATALMDGTRRYALLLRFVFKKYRDPGLSGVEPCVRKRTH